MIIIVIIVAGLTSCLYGFHLPGHNYDIPGNPHGGDYGTDNSYHDYNGNTHGNGDYRTDNSFNDYNGNTHGNGDYRTDNSFNDYNGNTHGTGKDYQFRNELFGIPNNPNNDKPGYDYGEYLVGKDYENDKSAYDYHGDGNIPDQYLYNPGDQYGNYPSDKGTQDHYGNYHGDQGTDQNSHYPSDQGTQDQYGNYHGDQGTQEDQYGNHHGDQGTQGDQYGNYHGDQGTQEDQYGNYHVDQGTQGDQYGNHHDDQVTQEDQYGNYHGDQGTQEDQYGNHHGDQGTQGDQYGNHHGDQGTQEDHYGNHHGDQGTQEDQYGNYHGDQGTQDDQYGNYHGDQVTHDDQYGNYPSDEGTQEDQYGIYRGDPGSHDDQYGNYPSDEGTQEDQYGIYRGDQGSHDIDPSYPIDSNTGNQRVNFSSDHVNYGDQVVNYSNDSDNTHPGNNTTYYKDDTKYDFYWTLYEHYSELQTNGTGANQNKSNLDDPDRYPNDFHGGQRINFTENLGRVDPNYTFNDTFDIIWENLEDSNKSPSKKQNEKGSTTQSNERTLKTISNTMLSTSTYSFPFTEKEDNQLILTTNNLQGASINVYEKTTQSSLSTIFEGVSVRDLQNLTITDVPDTSTYIEQNYETSAYQKSTGEDVQTNSFTVHQNKTDAYTFEITTRNQTTNEPPTVHHELAKNCTLFGYLCPDKSTCNDDYGVPFCECDRGLTGHMCLETHPCPLDSSASCPQNQTSRICSSICGENMCNMDHCSSCFPGWVGKWCDIRDSAGCFKGCLLLIVMMSFIALNLNTYFLS